MNNELTKYLLKEFGFDSICFTPISIGLINETQLLETNLGKYILQRINTDIFKNPQNIDDNIQVIKTYLFEQDEDYLFPQLVSDKSGKSLFNVNDGWYRVFEFIENATSIKVVDNASQAYEAAKQFGKFTYLLKNFPINQLKISLPQFHDLALRQEQFNASLNSANQLILNECQILIDKLKSNEHIYFWYNNYINNNAVKCRVTHHDTKISNVLFNEKQEAICVIDLDTIMPGYFLSDVGDMMRTYLCPVSEEENDLSKIEIRKDVLLAIKKGYLFYMNDELSSFEKEHFFFGGEMMIYMQALRFLTDYLNGDIYYHTNYPKQNMFRAANQIMLLEKYLEVIQSIN